MTTKDTIRHWYNAGVDQGYTHMSVHWDVFDGPHGDYPVYISATSVEDAKAQIMSNTDRLMEVYSYAVPLENQIDLHRSFTYDMGTPTKEAT